jgi:hypothetical protein
LEIVPLPVAGTLHIAERGVRFTPGITEEDESFEIVGDLGIPEFGHQGLFVLGGVDHLTRVVRFHVGHEASSRRMSLIPCANQEYAVFRVFIKNFQKVDRSSARVPLVTRPQRNGGGAGCRSPLVF